MEAASEALALEVQRFRETEQQAEYAHWDALYEAFARHLGDLDPDKWRDRDVELMLYALARDNEGEHLKELLENHPAHLTKLAEAGLGSREDEARRQLASALASLGPGNAKAADLLARYFVDQKEVVSRVALLALAGTAPADAEGAARRAWETGLEYQRVAALHVLSEIASPILSDYLGEAEQDGRASVLVNAAIAYYRRGTAHDGRGDHGRAIADYDHAIRLGAEPAFGSILMNRWGLAAVYHDRGRAHGLVGKRDLAIADFDEAIRRAPNYASAFHYRGVAHRDAGTLDRALADFSEAIRLDPGHTEAAAALDAARKAKGGA